jgi:hypothetical protein
MKPRLTLLIAAVVASVIPVRAHHSFAAEFDSEKPVTVQGAVQKVEWTNPHIWIYVDTKNGSEVVRWQCEGGSPNTLTRQGWSRDTLKVGDQVVIEGFRAKNGSNTCNSRVVRTADGKRLFAGSSLTQP